MVFAQHTLCERETTCRRRAPKKRTRQSKRTRRSQTRAAAPTRFLGAGDERDDDDGEGGAGVPECCAVTQRPHFLHFLGFHGSRRSRAVRASLPRGRGHDLRRHRHRHRRSAPQGRLICCAARRGLLGVGRNQEQNKTITGCY